MAWAKYLGVTYELSSSQSSSSPSVRPVGLALTFIQDRSSYLYLHLPSLSKHPISFGSCQWAPVGSPLLPWLLSVFSRSQPVIFKTNWSDHISPLLKCLMLSISLRIKSIMFWCLPLPKSPKWFALTLLFTASLLFLQFLDKEPRACSALNSSLRATVCAVPSD